MSPPRCEYLSSDYLMLYALTAATISLLAIRHRRQIRSG
jgi:hypothetical protein